MDYKKKVQDFIHKKTDKNKLIVIYGPTGSGKTQISIEIAKEIHSEIIGTDSRQIFKELNIGTGKITPSEKQDIPHHMIDIIPPNQSYSVGEFKKKSEKIIEQLWKKGNIPILVGGTGLYIDSLIYDFQIPKIPANNQLREKLEQKRLQKGNIYLWKQLDDIDPDYAKELHPNNYRYVIRGLEIKLLTGKSKLDFREKKSLKYDTLFLTPYQGDRELLYQNINKRVEQMFADGLVEEVSHLLSKYKKTDFGMQTIGYREVIEYLEGNIDLHTCIELVKKHNRNYAKKQLTWFNRYEN